MVSFRIIWIYIFLLGSVGISSIQAKTYFENIPELEPIKNPYENDWEIGKDEFGDYWVKGTIPEQFKNATTVFYIPSPRIFNYDFYLSDGENLTPVKSNMNSTGLNIRSRYPIYSIKTDQSHYYLHFKEELPQFHSYSIIEQIKYHEIEKIDLFHTGIYYGFLILSLIIYSVIYYILRDNRILSYTLLLLSVSLSFIYEDGLFYFFSNGALKLETFSVWTMGITAVLCLPFTYYFLDMNFPFFKRNQKALYFGLFIMLLLALAYTLTGDELYTVIIYSASLILPSICVYWAFIRIKKNPFAKFFIIVSALLIIGGFLYALNSHFSFTYLSAVDLSIFRIFCAVIFTLIGLAIIFKIKIIQDMDELNRQELNAYLIKLEKASTHIIHNDKDVQNVVFTQRRIIKSIKNQYNLNNFESEVLYEIWQGFNNKEISDKLNISITALKSHISNIYLKMDIKNQKDSLVFKDFVLK